MTQPTANHTRNTASHPEVSTASDDAIMCGWDLWVATRGLSRGLLLDQDPLRCGRVATYWLDLLYMTVYPPSESPLPLCDEHHAEVLRHFEGGVPNYRLVSEEVIETRWADQP